VITGLAFWKNEPDKFQLHAISKVEGDTKVVQINPDNAALRLACNLFPPEGTDYKSCTITSGIAPHGGTTFLSPLAVGGSNQVGIWSLRMKLDWIEIPVACRKGVLSAGEETEVDLILTTTDLDTGVYEASLRFDHTGIGDPITIPITLTVVPEESVYGTEEPLPTEFAITALYPNPFNARLNIAYALPQAGEAGVVLFDLNGREVHRQIAGSVNAGYHRFTLDCSHLPTGLYMVKLSTGKKSITQKALLLK